jgi:transposase
MNFAASEDRNTMPSAMSYGLASRPRGIPATNAAREDSGSSTPRKLDNMAVSVATGATAFTRMGTAIGDAGRAVSEVADAHKVSWPTAHRAFVAHAETLLAEPEPVAVLGLDETRRGKPRWVQCADTGRWVRVDPWDTGFVDLSGDQGLLGQREGRTSAAVIDWLSERSTAFREQIEFVAIDPAAVYAKAIRTPGLLPNATIVVDHFHLVKLGNDALTTVRRRVTWDLRDRRGRKADPEWANRRRLLSARERLSDKNFATMWNAIIDEAWWPSASGAA